MRQVFWDRREEVPNTSYERPYLQLPNPMHYLPQPEEEASPDEDDAPRVIVIEI